MAYSNEVRRPFVRRSPEHSVSNDFLGRVLPSIIARRLDTAPILFTRTMPLCVLPDGPSLLPSGPGKGVRQLRCDADNVMSFHHPQAAAIPHFLPGRSLSAERWALQCLALSGLTRFVHHLQSEYRNELSSANSLNASPQPWAVSLSASKHTRKPVSLVEPMPVPPHYTKVES